MRTRLAAIILFLLLSPLARAQKDHYADALATGTADGSSWVNAFTSLQQAADALAPRDTLHTRGTFFETATISTESVTILGDSDPTKPTWIRGDRYGSPEKWTPAGPEGVYVYQDVSQLIGSTLKPGSVVYDYKRDTLTGSVTGIDLRRFYSELPANGAGVYFGHLIKCNGISDVTDTPSSWWWDFANDRVSGVNTLCTPGIESNNGYGLKGTGTISVTFENADIIDPGWHAAGVETGSPHDCTLRNIRAWSSGADLRPRTSSSTGPGASTWTSAPSTPSTTTQ